MRSPVLSLVRLQPPTHHWLIRDAVLEGQARHEADCDLRGGGGGRRRSDRRSSGRGGGSGKRGRRHACCKRSPLFSGSIRVRSCRKRVPETKRACETNGKRQASRRRVFVLLLAALMLSRTTTAGKARLCIFTRLAASIQLRQKKKKARQRTFCRRDFCRFRVPFDDVQRRRGPCVLPRAHPRAAAPRPLQERRALLATRIVVVTSDVDDTPTTTHISPSLFFAPAFPSNCFSKQQQGRRDSSSIIASHRRAPSQPRAGPCCPAPHRICPRAQTNTAADAL